jgi:signal transduction histidine kinase/GAF domain-containing protein
VAEVSQEPSSDLMWPRLESWLTEARAQASARHETPPVGVDAWIDMARAAIIGGRAALGDHLSRLLSALTEDGSEMPPRPGTGQADLIAAVAAQFEAVLDVLSASDPPSDPDLWRYLMACQSAILAEASRLNSLPGQLHTTHLQALIEFSQKIAPILNLETLMEQAVSLIHQSFGYEYVHLFLMDAIGQQIVFRAGVWHGQPAKPGVHRLLQVGEEGIIGWVAACGEPAIVSDVTRDDRYVPHPGLPDVRSEMTVPLSGGERILGVLDVQSDRTGAFGQADQSLLQALASQVAIAIENARLHASMQRRMHEQTVLLYEISTAIGANLDGDAVLRTIAAKLTEALTVGGCTISQLDARNETITSVAEYVVISDQSPSHTWRTGGQPVPLSDDPVARQVLQTRRPVLLYSGEGKGTTAPLPSWQSPGWKALLALPLQLERRIIGLLELYDRQASRPFTPDDVRLLRALAHQTAMAMERTRLFNETRQRLNEVSELYTLANEIATNLNLTEVLDAIVQAIRRAMGCRGCCIFLLDAATQMLEIKAAAGLKPEWREAARLRLGEGIAGRAAAEVGPIYLPDTLQDPDYIFFDPEVRSLLAVPLQVKGRVIGVINVDDRVPNAFGSDQERLLTIAAAQAAIAIENARLFSQVLSEKQQTDAIIQCMADGLLMLDRNGVVVSCNPALAMMLDMQWEDVVGQRPSDPGVDPRLQSVCEPATVKERTGVLAREVEIPRTGPGGEPLRPRMLRVFSTILNDDADQRMGEVRVVHDVTREREIEEMKNEFFSTTSHELRTPLFSIQGFVRLILEGQVPDGETQREFLGIILQQADQLAQLVNNLLNISRLESGMLELERKPVSLLEVLQETVSKLRGIAQEKDIALETDLPASLPSVIGDQDWLEQVVTNLIGNAIKFTPEEGQVVVGVRQSKHEIMVEVTDTGIGIPADALDRIFTKFYRAPHGAGERPEGTGLGLYIAQQIIKAHGGRIWAESTLGQGSTFRFTLPYDDVKHET